MKFLTEKTFALFFILGIIFIPLSTLSTDWQYRISHFIFRKPIEFIQNSFLKIPSERIEISSDSIALGILLILIFLISILISPFIKNQTIISFSKSIITFYLIFILLKYGIDKIMGTQFYTPEPNILYSNFGNLDKDILFWSVNGLSKTYCIITGFVEVFTGLLLFSRRTRLIGLLISTFVFVQIVIINFSFDISVKIYSIFLLAMTVFLLFPYLKPLKNIFFSEKPTTLQNPKISFVQNSFINQWIQFFLLGLFLLQIVYPYFISENSNELKFEGAYEITQTIYKNDTLSHAEFPYKKVFFHKDNFLIFQKQNDEMIDFHYQILPEKKQISLMDYQQNEFVIDYKFHKNDLILELNFNEKDLYLKSQLLDWKRLPALKHEFHFFIEDVR